MQRPILFEHEIEKLNLGTVYARTFRLGAATDLVLQAGSGGGASRLIKVDKMSNRIVFRVRPSPSSVGFLPDDEDLFYTDFKGPIDIHSWP